MKKLLLLVAIIVMAGTVNAQQHCNTNGCTVGYYDSDGFYVFGSCTDQLAVNCQSDPENCGGVGRVCALGVKCQNGECQRGEVLPWDDGENAQHPPSVRQFRLRPIQFKHWK